MKKFFLDGLRSKADWQFNGVILGGVLITFAYLKVGRADWSRRLAVDVSFGWKCFVLILVLVVSAYTCREILRGIVDRSLPRMNPAWLLFECMLLFLFAILSADRQTLFNVGTLLWAGTIFGTARYYRQSLKRGRQTNG
jgi:hypothetical protein